MDKIPKLLKHALKFYIIATIALSHIRQQWRAIASTTTEESSDNPHDLLWERRLHDSLISNVYQKLFKILTYFGAWFMFSKYACSSKSWCFWLLRASIWYFRAENSEVSSAMLCIPFVNWSNLEATFWSSDVNWSNLSCKINIIVQFRNN